MSDSWNSYGWSGYAALPEVFDGFGRVDGVVGRRGLARRYLDYPCLRMGLAGMDPPESAERNYSFARQGRRLRRR